MKHIKTPSAGLYDFKFVENFVLRESKSLNKKKETNKQTYKVYNV